MPLIPYRTTFDDPAAARAAAQTRERRGGHLINLDRMLLHFPAMAEGWNALMGAIRRGDRISALHRELAICAVAWLTGAKYEIFHHRILLIEAGASEAQADALADVARATADERLFDAAERAILAFALDSTRDVAIRAETGAALTRAFPDPAAVVELMLVIASYNMVSRVLVGLGVDTEDVEPVTG